MLFGAAYKRAVGLRKLFLISIFSFDNFFFFFSLEKKGKGFL